MRKRSVLAIAVVSAVVLSAVVISNAAKATPTKKDPASFWTADKIKKAVAFNMVFEKGAKLAKRVAVDPLKPGGEGGSTTLGAPWNKGGLPLTATGKVYFAIGFSYYQCSGALIDDDQSDRSIVLTAGHCVYDNDTNQYVTNWIFIPSFDVQQVSISGCTASTICWAADQVFAHDGFTSQTGFTDQATWYDWGFAVITDLKSDKLPDGGSGNGTDGTNSFPYSFSELSVSTAVSAFGYPAAGKYKGRDLIYSSGPIVFDAYNQSKTYGLASTMTGGSSGGPWLSSFATTAPYSGTLSSVNSYKYGSSKYMYGPKFNSNTADTFNEARLATLQP